jgi:hypothetical protein
MSIVTRDLFKSIVVAILVISTGIGLALSILFVLSLIFSQLNKVFPEKKCAIEFSDGSKVQAVNCDIYRDSTNLDCAGINFSMYAVKSWKCK